MHGNFDDKAELYPLPPKWIWLEIQEVAEIVTGNTPPKSNPENFGNLIPFVKPSDLYQGTSVTTSDEYLSETGAEYARVIPPQSVMVTCIGSLGKIGLNKVPVATNQQINSMVFYEGLDSRFIYYYCNWFFFQKLLVKNASATTIAIINKSRFSLLPIPLAPYNEQLRIVEAIETEFTRIDEGMKLLQRLRDNLKRYKAAVLKAACEGRLVPQDPTDEPASDLLKRILRERRVKWQAEGRKGKYVEPQPPDTTDLPDLPEGWVWASIEQLAAHEPYSITDGPFGSNLKTSHYTEKGPRVIRLQNIGDGEFIDSEAHISPEHFELLRKHQIFASDLVIAALGESLPRACIIPEFVGPAIVKADCMRFKPQPELANRHYLNHALNSEPVKKIASKAIHGVGRPRLNQQEVKSIAIPLPPINEQSNVVERIELCFSIVQEVAKLIEDNLTRAERLRQAILKEAFEGKLVPQDPDDEPASVLLHQIKASRNGRGKK